MWNGINFLGDNSTPNGSLKIRFEGPKCSGAKLELELAVGFSMDVLRVKCLMPGCLYA
jgi:hypothetical protein